mmetsp:Transcript_35420/g.53592  ORF Transcript_35420/g.53592 Transcript_35420/m.53592 type:complete len:1046 (-) Transcript_35420:483-3620(-)
MFKFRRFFNLIVSVRMFHVFLLSLVIFKLIHTHIYAQAIAHNPEIPILGVCLGHQALGYYYNASVILSPDGPIHGQLSGVHYNAIDHFDDLHQHPKDENKEQNIKCNLFHGIPQQFDVVRYHSLAVEFPRGDNVELNIEPIAWCDTLPPMDDKEKQVCMALQHKQYPHYGVQFHPESIGSGENGYKVLENFCDFVSEYWKIRRRSNRNFYDETNQMDGDICTNTLPVAAQGKTDLTGTKEDEKGKKQINGQTTEKNSRYHVLIHKIPPAKTISVSPEQVYEAFFMTHSNSFWLDSSTGCLPSSTSSSSQTSPNNECPIKLNSRFSIMGGDDGPLSRRIEYYGEDFPSEERGLRIISAADNDAAEKVDRIEGDVLSYLRKRIVKEAELIDFVDLVDFGNDEHDDDKAGWGLKVHSDRLEEFPREITESSSMTLPFEYRGGYVGYLGYEVRHDTRRYIMEQEKQRVEKTEEAMKTGNGSKSKRKNANREKRGTLQSNSKKHTPTAAFLFADRSVLYDHWMNEWYVIGVASTEDYFHHIVTNNGEEKENVFVKKEDVTLWIEKMAASMSKLSVSHSSVESSDGLYASAISEKNDSVARKKIAKSDTINFVPNRPKHQYQADITRCHEEIRNGETYELCVTNQLEASLMIPASVSLFHGNHSCFQEEDKEDDDRFTNSNTLKYDMERTPYGLYKILRERNPAPFAAFLKLNGGSKANKENNEQQRREDVPTANVSICCSSPERFLSVKKDSTFSARSAFERPRFSNIIENLQECVTDENDTTQRNSYDYSLSTAAPFSAKYYQVESKPIKGTAARYFLTKQQNSAVPTSKNSSSSMEEEDEEKREDQRIANGLRESVKNRAENLMIVDLLRNDLSRVCKIGSVHVPRLMHIESFATVHQMVSTIRGTLESHENDTNNAIDVISACFPGGSMTGAPKLRTMDILDEMEGVTRGPYSGSLGYISLNGCMDMNIIIRTAVLTPCQDSRLSGNVKTNENNEGHTCWQTSIGAGGAITALSESDDEYEEMLLKAKAVKNAIQEWANQVGVLQCK